MSILINGMGMPENCWNCPLQYDYICCSVMDDIKLTDENIKKRDSSCPLEEVSCMNSEKTHDVISRQEAIDAIVNWAESHHENPDGDDCIMIILDVPPVQPELDEWCTDCKEYDHEKYCCPRFNRVIRQTLIDAQSEIIRCKDCKHFEYDHPYIIQGVPVLGHEVCNAWGDGCKTDENGYCFLAERRTDE